MISIGKEPVIKSRLLFTNATTSVYGQANSWNWEFGEDDIAISFSDKKDPAYTYAALGIKRVRLIAGNTFGCIDTIFKDVKIFDKPPITLLFRDTLICANDSLQLSASGKGNFSWTQIQNIYNSATDLTPRCLLLLPQHILLTLTMTDVLIRDSVKVRVTDHVSLLVMNDTTVCKGDTIQLKVNSDGFKYLWTPANQVINPIAKNPLVTTTFLTSYKVTASIGSCIAAASIQVTPVPYPLANAGNDTIICYNTIAQLHGSSDGTSFNWAPASTLTNITSLNPIAKPATTTQYIMLAYDTKGCPKPGRGAVLVTVLPKIHAFAGNDTAIVIGQPLQLHASGGLDYVWTPATGLSSNTIADPVASYNEPFDQLQYKLQVYDQAHCVDSDFMNVKVFKTVPTVFVPNVFSPNGDGKNELLRPVTVGMRSLEYFNVYNRWGQLVYSTAKASKGWDGSFAGRQQDPGVFAWTVRALDYLGRIYVQKGTVLLTR